MEMRKKWGRAEAGAFHFLGRISVLGKVSAIETIEN
jgi:hypothetical protein